MKILLIAPPWFAVPPESYGGIEWIVALLADGLSDAGHDVTLVASGGSETHANLHTVYDTPPSEAIGDLALELTHVLAGYLEPDSVDIIHDHSGLMGPALGAIANQVPVVHTLHGPWTDQNRDLYARLSDHLHLVAISHSQAEQAPDGVRVAAVIHNAVALNRYPLSTHKDDFLLYVGRSCHEKGPEVAVDVARRLGRKLIMAMKVNEPPEHEYFHREVEPRMEGADVDLRTNVEHEEKADLMGRAAVVVDPIQWEEPFGLVMIESMACGTPVVAFAKGAAPEIIVDGRTGRLVPPGDVDAMCAAVAEAEQLDPLECRSHVEDQFSAERMVAEHVQLYQRVVHRTHGTAPDA